MPPLAPRFGVASTAGLVGAPSELARSTGRLPVEVPRVTAPARELGASLQAPVLDLHPSGLGECPIEDG